MYTPTQLEKMQGPWIRTFTKRIINPLALTIDDVDIDDIAHHLAIINRFAGALRYPISVAQHSVCVSRLIAGWAGEEYAMYGLLHDASEAYLGDVSKWLKKQDVMSGYRDAEDRAQNIIYERFGLAPIDMDHESGSILEQADRLMVRVEGQLGFDIPELIPDNPRYAAVSDSEWDDVNKLIGPHLLAEMDWRTAKMYFLIEHRNLTRIK